MRQRIAAELKRVGRRHRPALCVPSSSLPFDGRMKYVIQQSVVGVPISDIVAVQRMGWGRRQSRGPNLPPWHVARKLSPGHGRQAAHIILLVRSGNLTTYSYDEICCTFLYLGCYDYDVLLVRRSI